MPFLGMGERRFGFRDGGLLREEAGREQRTDDGDDEQQQDADHEKNDLQQRSLLLRFLFLFLRLFFSHDGCTFS